MRGSTRKSKIDPQEFLLLWEAGVRTYDIAEHFDVTPPTISKYVIAHDLPRRRNGYKQPMVITKVEDVIIRFKAPDGAVSTIAVKPKPRWSYADVDRMVANGMTRTQALQKFHRMRG